MCRMLHISVEFLLACIFAYIFKIKLTMWLTEYCGQTKMLWKPSPEKLTS